MPGFLHLIWRNLNENNPDDDEWQQLIASDQFYTQMTILLNKLRIAERSLQQYKRAIPDWSLRLSLANKFSSLNLSRKL